MFNAYIFKHKNLPLEFYAYIFKPKDLPLEFLGKPSPAGSYHPIIFI